MKEIIPKLDHSRFETVIKAVDTHTGGEFTRVVYAGIPEPQGSTMIEKKQWLAANCDELRRALTHEPRGHHDSMGAILCQPVHEECAFGVIFIDTGGFLNMCGHGTMGVATMLVECGLVPVCEPYTEFALDMPAGVIRVRVEVDQGRAVAVSLVNVPAFLWLKDQKAVVDGKEYTFDISFGGSFFALVDAEKNLGVTELIPDYAERLARLGVKLRSEINRTITVKHPLLDINQVDLVEFYTRPPHPERADMRNMVVFGEAQVDRSPCGTGTTAKLAALHAHGRIGIGEQIVNESIIGSLFRGEIISETVVGDIPAVNVRLTGSAYITGQADYLIDGRDPLKYGFLIPRS